MHFFASPPESSDEVEIARMVNAPSGIELCLLHSVSEKEVILQSTVAERRERLRVLAGSFEEETNRLVIGIQMVEVFEDLYDSLNRDFVDRAPVAFQNGLNASRIPRANGDVDESSLRVRKVDALSLGSGDLLHAESVRILAIQEHDFCIGICNEELRLPLFSRESSVQARLSEGAGVAFLGLFFVDVDQVRLIFCEAVQESGSPMGKIGFGS